MSEQELLLQLADDELVLGWRDSEWTGIAPFLEEDVAFSSIAQNEIGHARAIYELLADDADALAFDREPDEYVCAPLVELRFVPDWARTIARRVLYEAADEIRVGAAQALRRRRRRRARGEDRPRGGLPPHARADVGRPAGGTSRAIRDAVEELLPVRARRPRRGAPAGSRRARWPGTEAWRRSSAARTSTSGRLCGTR